MTITPLRYAGGKQRQRHWLVGLFPPARHLVSPFTGGGSVEIEWLRQNPSGHLWINDLNPGVALFWLALAEGRAELIAQHCRRWLSKIAAGDTTPVALGEWLRGQPRSAAQWFALNRLSFSGTERGGFGKSGSRFTEGAIARLEACGQFLQGRQVTVTAWDYRDVINAVPALEGSALLWLDPPYPSASASDLYGRHDGPSLHRGFDLGEFAEVVESSRLPFVATIDNTAANQGLFAWAEYRQANWDYGMARGAKRWGKEAIVSRFEGVAA